MASGAEIALMKKRRDAAKSALKFFTKTRGVKSTNNPFAGTTNNDQRVLDSYRNNNPDTITQSFEDAARTGIGNCDEKGRMCYAALVSNPMILGNSIVTLCSAINYDHVFVVVTDAPIGNPAKVSRLGKTLMVCDGWTQDWYFPNLSLITAKVNGLGYVPNPRQIYVRIQVAAHLFKPYFDGDVPVFNDSELITNSYGREND